MGTAVIAPYLAHFIITPLSDPWGTALGGPPNVCLLLGVDRGDTSTWTSQKLPKLPGSYWSWRKCSPAQDEGWA